MYAEVASSSSSTTPGGKRLANILWWVASGFIVVWFVLKFVLHKGGMVHVLLLAGISILVVQIAAYRKTKYQKSASRK